MQLLKDADSPAPSQPEPVVHRRTNRRWTTALGGMAVGLLLGVPIVGIAWIQSRPDRFDVLDRPVAAAVVDVTTEDVDEAQPATAIAHWAPPAQLVAPTWTGVVSSAAPSGTTLRSGDTVAVVNGITRLVWALDAPFHRPLSSGATGADVGQLQTVLTALGFLDGEIDSRFGSATGAAVRDLSELLGVSPTTSTFDPNWIVWMPAAEWTIAETKLVVGAPAPTAGTPIVVGPVQLTGFELHNSDDATVDPDGWTVTISGTDIALDPAATDTPPAGLSTLLKQPVAQGSTYPDTQTPVTIRRTTAVAGIKVPASAVSTSDTGAACVWTPTGTATANSYEAQPVEVVASRAAQGTVWVTAAADITQVLANPNEVLEDARCPLD